MGSLEEFRQGTRGAQHVGHQRSAPRPEFDQVDASRPAHRVPDLDHPRAEQFAEDLADFRGGDEVAMRPRRIARRVIVPEANIHIAFDRHRPVEGDHVPKIVPQAAHAVSRRDCVAPRNATAITAIPRSAMGSDSTIPMVMPPLRACTDLPNRNPSCSSGSRKNSHAMRAIAYPRMKMPPSKPGRRKPSRRTATAITTKSTSPSPNAS